MVYIIDDLQDAGSWNRTRIVALPYPHVNNKTRADVAFVYVQEAHSSRFETGRGFNV